MKVESGEELWKRLFRINKIIMFLFVMLTKPFMKYAPKIIVRLPFSNFFFRPLFLNEIYMALGLWEPYVRRNLPLSKGDIFIDVGAHIGYYTVYASHRVGENGLVIAIEPDRRNLKVLYKNIRAKNIRVYEAAVGFNGFIYLSPCENPLYTKTAKKRINGLKRVPSISLDSLLEEVEKLKPHSVVVKIDVEGSELDVIKGGIQFLKIIKPILIIEASKPNELESILKHLGYTSSNLFGGYFIFQSKNASYCTGRILP